MRNRDTARPSQGSFVFQGGASTPGGWDHGQGCGHAATGSMVTVVPSSGTGALAGLSGNFKITITEGKHFYEKGRFSTRHFRHLGIVLPWLRRRHDATLFRRTE
ncbi:MAG: DUF3224 domain-containing protein [Betaproteobacteria bacterium]|nr:DUF3224 domain-containing protein [Betaproteobacteria bacterium]